MFPPRHFLAGLFTALVVSGLFGEVGWSQAARPTVLVEVDVSMLPADFNPSGQDLPKTLRTAFEAEAAQLLEGEFKLFAWMPHSAMATPAADMPRLRLILSAQRFVTWRIRFEARCLVPNLTGPQGDFAAFSEELFYQESHLPDPDQIKRVTLDRGRTALLSLISGNKPIWQEKLVRRIPLADDLLLGPEQAKWLVVPLQAADLQAHPNSKFEARIFTNHPMAGMSLATIWMRPGGQVFGTHPLAGMLRCDLAEFQFNGETFFEWVRDVPVVVCNREHGKVRVHAVHYEREYVDISFSP